MKRLDIIALCFWILSACLVAQTILCHDLQIALDPLQHRLEIKDTLTCRAHTLEFVLNGDLAIYEVSPGWELENLGTMDADYAGINAWFPDLGQIVRLCRYRLVPTEELPPGETRVCVCYRGDVFFPRASLGELHARSCEESPGVICPQGVYLSGAAFWYPWCAGDLPTFRMAVRSPLDWCIISHGRQGEIYQGEDHRVSQWECTAPLQEICVAGGPLLCYRRQESELSAAVYLHESDPELAEKYLDATFEYVAMYSRLLGPYPYPEFSLVENFWETGYGMPGFTLLGPQVIRLPFILRTSYPHEILHNWWGNGVMVAYEEGNWCEGLTTYLADHLGKEQQGLGAEYRRDILQKYRNVAHSDRDFPLAQFRARHSPITESVGYGKSLMLFHELRMRVGDEIFLQALRRFYRDFCGREACFADIERIFTEVSGQDLARFFRERVEFTGAPQIQVAEVYAEKEDKWVLHFTLRQTAPNGPYSLHVPVAITVENQRDVLWMTVPLEHEVVQMALSLENRPVRLDIDPQFDLFRKVDRSEIPPCIGQVFGAGRVFLVMAKSAPEQWRQAYEQLAQKWGIEVLCDDELASLPTDAAVWFVGADTRFGDDLKRWFSLYGVRFAGQGVEIEGKSWDASEYVVVLSTAHPEQEETAIGWIFGGAPQAYPAMARKLPHYGKYSYLAFDHDATNVAKGQWPILCSIMTEFLDATAIPMGTLPARKSLLALSTQDVPERLMSHVRFLSSPERKGRGLGTPELDLCAQYIADRFRNLGLKPEGDGENFFQTWEETVSGKSFTLTNVVALLPGTDERWQDSPVVAGAHYDHLGLGWPDVKKGNAGQIHPGADDNASGVAVLLELAAIFSERPQARPIVFVAFTAEEAGQVGSRHFAATQKHRDILAMVNLDTVGRLYGQDILVLGVNSAREWPDIVHGTSHTTHVNAAQVLDPMDSSDHMSFIEQGIPAVQILTPPHGDYHTPGDTIDKIDASGLAKVTSFAQEMLKRLAGRYQPLTAEQPEPTPPPQSKRRSALGTIPDFTYTGKGVRITRATPESAAARALLQEGDIIVALGEFEITGLSDLAQALAHYPPKTRVNLQYLRDGALHSVEIVLDER